MNAIVGWVVAYLSRWLPHRAATGLRKIGSPDEKSPVIVTGNFSLTVKRVIRALAGQDVWVLVANSGGINVWCAATGGEFTEKQVIDAITISRLGEKVAHREVILPALAAPGMDRRAILDETGFRARFGPVYARDIPAYLARGGEKTEEMCRFRFDLRHRLDMLVSMNMPLFAVAAAVVAAIRPGYLLEATAVYWGAAAFLYLFIEWIPGRTGWAQAAISATAVVAGWALVNWLFFGEPLREWGWFVATFGAFLAVGFDGGGIVAGRRSDAEALLQRMGVKKIGSVFSEKELGEIALERGRCTGCGTCREVCPIGVFGELDDERKVTFRDQGACFSCGACVKQCPADALKLV